MPITRKARPTSHEIGPFVSVPNCVIPIRGRSHKIPIKVINQAVNFAIFVPPFTLYQILEIGGRCFYIFLGRVLSSVRDEMVNFDV